MTGIMLFEKENLKIRKLEFKDNYLLAKWLSNPIVLEYYDGRDNPFDLEKVNKHFFDRNDSVYGCIIEYEEQEIGYIQYYQLDEQTTKTYGLNVQDNIYGMDQFIGEVDYWNKGIGKLLVSSMVDYLLEQKQAGKVVMDPQACNVRAIKCYEKCGFKKVKLLPKHELHEGEYRDCWLMEYNYGGLHSND